MSEALSVVGVESLNEGRTVVVSLPTQITVLVYKSSTHIGWNTHVMLDAVDTFTGESGSFGSLNTYSDEPTRRQVADHIFDQIRHEIEEQLGLDPHGVVT